MRVQDGQVDGHLTPEVTTALLDFARLSQHAGSVLANTVDIVADLLLERLLLLCKAQHGALFLTAQGYVAPGQTFLPFSSSSKTLRALALREMREEEARILLAAFPSVEAEIQIAPGQPRWIVCSLPISASPVHQQDGFKADSEYPQRGASGKLLQSTNLTTLPLQALLMVGWTELNEDGKSTESTIERGRHILPLVAEAAGAVLINILLAERVQELETATARKTLYEMELLKAELLATVSHELRSPLASIKGYTATLIRHERRISREERHEFLLAIQEASDRLEVIIDRLLETSQLETGSIKIERSPVDVARLAREAITTAEQRVSGQAPGHFTFNLQVRDAHGAPTSEAPMIMADQRRLREVLDNLLDNAMKYSPKGGAIDIILRPAQSALPGNEGAQSIAPPEPEAVGAQFIAPPPLTQQAKQVLEICIADNGLGIPAEHLGRIFDRFHRVDTRLTREVNGLGLGLTICKRIVELHNGVIWAESCPAGGSAFHVWLPVDEEKVEESLASLIDATPS